MRQGNSDWDISHAWNVNRREAEQCRYLALELSLACCRLCAVRRGFGLDALGRVNCDNFSQVQRRTKVRSRGKQGVVDGAGVCPSMRIRWGLKRPRGFSPVCWN